MEKILIGGLVGVVICFVAMLVYHMIRAAKDPDVQAASDLRMSVTRYRHYRKLYDEYQDFMRVHGIHSAASEKKFMEIFKQIENPNEWRRYQDYRMRK